MRKISAVAILIFISPLSAAIMDNGTFSGDFHRQNGEWKLTAPQSGSFTSGKIESSYTSYVSSVSVNVLKTNDAFLNGTYEVISGSGEQIYVQEFNVEESNSRIEPDTYFIGRYYYRVNLTAEGPLRLRSVSAETKEFSYKDFDEVSATIVVSFFLFGFAAMFIADVLTSIINWTVAYVKNRIDFKTEP